MSDDKRLKAAMLVIINADDLGATREVNDAIFELMDAGLVTSATLMANGQAAEHAFEGLRRFPHCSFGIHLNGTSYRPLNPSPELSPVLDSDGNLSTKLQKARPDAALRNALFDELSAQVQRALDAGVPISHFDSHHHIHVIPWVFPVLKALQKRFGVRKVRGTISLLPPGERMSMTRRISKAVFTTALRNWHPTTTTAQGVGDFRVFHELLEKGEVPKLKSLELMVHPGAMGPKYLDEIAHLRSNWRTRLGDSIRLMSYGDLTRY